MGDARPVEDTACRLAVVVMSLACEPGLVDAVRSVRDQSPRAELVVVNSGGGDPEGVLRSAGIDDVPVIHREERLFPGAVRNLGIAATRAPYVAFLAADCLAEPGWVAARLRAHDNGSEAVGSLLCNAYPGSRSAAASALLLHHRRMAHAKQGERITMGLSFDRRLLERLGPFREDLRTGEDSEFKGRMNGTTPVLPAGVVTAHRYPRRPDALLRDQFHRGVRQARARGALGMRRRRARLPLEMLLDAARALRWTAAVEDPASRRRLRRGWPLIPFAAAAYAAGSIAANALDARRA